MSSNYQQKKMMNALGAIDTKGNIVLEQFQDGTALLFQPGNLTEFFLVDLQVPLIPSWAVISTQKSIKLPSTRTCPCSARSSQSFRIPSKADINVWMSMPQDSPPARSFIFTARTEVERIIRSAISSWASARWTNEAVSHSPSSRPM